LVDVYETIDGKTIQSLSAEERLQYERNPLYKARDPRLYATVMMHNGSIKVNSKEEEGTSIQMRIPLRQNS